MSEISSAEQNTHIFYDPCTILKPLADAVKLNLDQLNYVLCLFVSFAIGVWFRLQFQNTSRQSRALFTTFTGLFLCYFCYGNATVHLFLNAFGSYLLMLTIDSKIVNKVVFGFSMGYLVLIHFYRWMYQTSYCMDVTSSTMMAVGKITLIATSIHDGMDRDPKKLSNSQEKNAIREIPSLLDYSSYIFNFQTVLAGPIIGYSSWSEFLDEKHVPKDKSGKIYDPLDTAMRKMQIATVFAVVFAVLTPFFPMSVTSDPEYNKLNFFIWWFYHSVSSTVLRCQYYFAWILSDATCNASGFGFNGLDKETNEPKWSGVTNVNPLNVEMARNYKEIVDNWNISTAAWLKNVVYERVEGKYRTFAVYATGAVWHGISAGYYFSFMTSALFTLSAATFRRCVRHYFTDDPYKKMAYDVFGIIVTRFVISYNHYPFYIMNLVPSLFTYIKFLFLPQIVALLIIFYLPTVLPPISTTRSEQVKSSRNTVTSSTRTAVDTNNNDISVKSRKDE